MPDAYPSTTSALLQSLRDAGNHAVWGQFDARYRPIVAAVARRVGLGREDAAEVAQQALAEFAQAYAAGRYDRERGRLRSWLINIAQHRATDMLRRQSARREERGESGMIHRPARIDELTEAWETERRRAILQEALGILRTRSRVSENTIRAFELVALRGMAAEQAGAECGMSADEVYVARTRVTARLRRLVEKLTLAYDTEE